MAIDKKFVGYKRWKSGTTQELIPEKGEGIEDAIRHMREHLDYFDIADLTFFPNQIVYRHGKYYVTLRHKSEESANAPQNRLAFRH
jgi:hypothetical protein